MKINNDELEFLEDTHTYLVNGIIVPSITQILRKRFGHKYDGIPAELLNERARYGTVVHKAIEVWCRNGDDCDLPEVRNFKFLQKIHGFAVHRNEVPVILYREGEPCAAGRLDLILEKDGQLAVADVKTTSALDKEYLGCQLNLYRTAYRQSYGEDCGKLYGIHLRGDKRKLTEIPVNEDIVEDILKEYEEGSEEYAAT